MTSSTLSNLIDNYAHSKLFSTLKKTFIETTYEEDNMKSKHVVDVKAIENDIDFFLLKVFLCYQQLSSDSNNIKILIGEEIDVSKYIKNMKLMCDVAVLSDSKAYIIDFDYTKGKIQKAKGNPEMMSLALAINDKFCNLYPVKEYELIIYQPLLDNISTWKLDTVKLKSF